MPAFHYDPFYDVERFIKDMFDRFTTHGHSSTLERQNGNDVQRSIRPRMDLHENAESNTVTASFELPGMKKEDVQIDAQNGWLSVSAESKMPETHDKDRYAIRERRFGKFSRTLQLPHGVKETEVKAAMDNGVLTVTFPKSTAQQACFRISML
ncbi:HSP20-like chaperone [Mycena leptocephala]|nr:HSP20-like chaperone [Mycena leptocephala]